MSDEPDERERGAPSLYSLDKSIAVIRAELKALTANIDRRLDTIDLNVRDAVNKYATLQDLKSVSDEVAEIKKNISWGVKIVVGAVLLAIVSLLIAKGNIPVPHT